MVGREAKPDHWPRGQLCKSCYNAMVENQLKLSPEVVGVPSGEKYFKVSFRDASNFAAAINDTSEIFYHSKHVSVHPLQVVTLTWQLLQDKENKWKKFIPPAWHDRLVHYDEHLEINRPVEVGEELVADSRIVSMTEHKLGTKIQTKATFTSAKGELIVTEYASSIFFGVQCEAEREIEKSPIDIKKSNDEITTWEELVDIPKTAPYLYDGCTNISALIHTDDAYARAIGLPGIIYHGTATLARAISCIIQRELQGDPARIKAISTKFVGKLTVPNILKVRLSPREDRILPFQAFDNNDQVILIGNIKI